jgi:hypothetical protein
MLLVARSAGGQKGLCARNFPAGGQSPLGVIRDRVQRAARPVTSAMPPRAEVNSERWPRERALRSCMPVRRAHQGGQTDAPPQQINVAAFEASLEALLISVSTSEQFGARLRHLHVPSRSEIVMRTQQERFLDIG